MGANGAYSRGMISISDEAKRTMIDTDYRVDYRKVLVFKHNPMHDNIPVISSSDSPIYLCASVDETGIITISAIGVYENHRIQQSIDLKFDSKGNAIPFAKGDENSCHMHKWFDNAKGNRYRNPHDPDNVYSVPQSLKPLIKKIVKFNKAHNVWKKKD